MRLLLAEDEKSLSRALVKILEHSNYSVDAVYDGEEALDYLDAGNYDGVILDIMMPKIDGLTVLQTIRRKGSRIPVLLLTAKAEIDDRVTGLDAGADDYLTKPFAMKELLARVRSMTRRNAGYNRADPQFADITLHAEKLELVSRNSVRLAAKECELLQLLIMNDGRALETEEIIRQVWPGDKDAGADKAFLYISYLRGKLRAVGSDVTIIGEQGGNFRLFLPKL